MNDQNTNISNDFIVSSLLSELKNSNISKDKTIKSLLKIICGSFVAVVILVGGFLWYLNQYDFSSSETISATGVYTLVDSEGNIIAQDAAPEDIESMLDVLNGENNSETYSEEN